jgi:hypothetical protein
LKDRGERQWKRVDQSDFLSIIPSWYVAKSVQTHNEKLIMITGSLNWKNIDSDDLHVISYIDTYGDMQNDYHKVIF